MLNQIMRFLILLVIVYSSTSFSCQSITKKWRSCRTTFSKMSRYESFMARSLNLKHKLVIKNLGDQIVFQASKRKIIRSEVIYTDSFYKNGPATYMNFDIDGYKMPNFTVDISCGKNSLSKKFNWTNLDIYNFPSDVVKSHSRSYLAEYKVKGKKLIKSFYRLGDSKKKLIGKIICR